MLNFLRRKRNAETLPTYSELKALPSSSFPGEPEGVATRFERIERELLESARRLPDDAPLLTDVLVDDQSLLMSASADGEQCLLAFGTRFRAADYVRTIFTSGLRAQFVSSSASQFVRMLGKLRELGVDCFTIDRCPRRAPRRPGAKFAMLSIWSVYHDC